MIYVCTGYVSGDYWAVYNCKSASKLPIQIVFVVAELAAIKWEKIGEGGYETLKASLFVCLFVYDDT